MLPVPSTRAAVAFCAAAVLLLVGLFGGSPTVSTLAIAGLAAIALSLALTVPITERLKRQRIELAWWHGHGKGALGSAAVVGATFEVRCELRNRGPRGLWLEDLSPVVPGGTRVLSPQHPTVWLPAGTRTQLSFALRADAVGRVVLQGLSVAAPGPLSLFAAPLYFPSPLTIQVLPRAAHRPARAVPTEASLSVERPGPTSVRRRGDGMELRELRELQPGDAFHSIAWKASARRGKLLVREMEREVQETLYLLVDVSGTMRGGAPGARRLDQAIELTAFAARDALERGDQVGLITVDGRILDHVAPAAGLPHMLRLYEALISTTEVVDADLTEITDDEVETLLASYLRQQDGARLKVGQRIDQRALLSRARTLLRGDTRVARVVADDPDHALLRRLCQVRGLPLPYRADTRAFSKGRGLDTALMTAAGRTRMPRTIVLFSDFDGVTNMDRLGKTLTLLQARAHHLVVVCPEDHRLVRDPPADREQALRVAFGMQEERRQRGLRRFLTRAGVPVVAAAPDENPARVVARALRQRRVA